MQQNTGLSADQSYALNKFKQKNNLFITGPGGTGKTRLIEHFVEYAKSNATPIQVCALTGCASILLSHCNARTIHSWSGIRLAKGPGRQIIQNTLKNRQAVSSWKKVKILVIDEVSMLSLKVFELLEELARTTRKDPRPFGGIQVIFTGDFYQLPPVGTVGDPETERFCFESPLWSKVFDQKNHVQLTTIFRQLDPLYRTILLQVRTNTLTEENQEILKTYVKREYDPAKYNGCLPTKLYPTRAKADFLNASMFQKIEEPEHIFECTKKMACRTFLETNAPLSVAQLQKCAELTRQDQEYEIQQLMQNSSIQEAISLKKGAVVMCTVNLDMDQGICNGSQGIIIDFCNNNDGSVPGSSIMSPVVKFYNGITKTINPHFRQSDDYPSLAVGQIPLSLAWALTIHKIQGATLALADIDVGGQIFEYGQTYVALSRVQSLDGLYLSAFNPQKIRTNPKVQDFYQTIPPIPEEIAAVALESHALVSENIFDQYTYKESIIVSPPSSYVQEPLSSGSTYVQEPLSSGSTYVQEPLSSGSTYVQEPRKLKTSEITLGLFKEGKPMKKIAEERGLKLSTIRDHLMQQIPDPALTIDDFMSSSRFEEIGAAYKVLYNPIDPSGISLKTIKESISNNIGYDDIKIACRFLETQQQQQPSQQSLPLVNTIESSIKRIIF
jgi:ATP-dependent DNA helicase PIF1